MTLSGSVSFRELRRDAQQRLIEKFKKEKISPDVVALEIDLLLQHVLSISRESLIARLDDTCSPEISEQFLALLERRLRSEPIAYIIGVKEFYSYDFKVGPDVLIPRPDTEILVEKALEFCLKTEEPLVVIDVGTGSGAIIISVALELKRKGREDVLFLASDYSREALKIADQNACRHGVRDEIQFIESDLLKGVLLSSSLKRKLVLLANLPYVATQEDLPLDVSDFEPKQALFSGETGLETIFRFCQLISMYPVSLIVFLEIGLGQAAAVESHLLECGFCSSKAFPDFSGRARLIEGVKN